MTTLRPGPGARDFEPLHALFDRTAARAGGDSAIRHGDRVVTYAELARMKAEIAACLRAFGLPAGSLVGIYSRSPATVAVCILAVLEAGGVFVPLEPGFPAMRLERMIAHVRPAAFLADAALVPALRELLGPADAGAAIVALEGGRFADRATLLQGAVPGQVPAPRTPAPDDPASVYFTSGSTGAPKAILGRLKGIDHFVRWEREMLAVQAGTRMGQLASPAFDGYLREMFVPLCSGAVACIPPDRETILDGNRLVAWMEAAELQILQCVPSVFRGILNAAPDPARLRALRQVTLVGEAVLAADVRRWRDRFGTQVRVINLYGPTETTMIKLFHEITADDVERGVIPIGRPIPGAAALVLDARLRPCPPGAVGEIFIRTPYRSLGYLRDDAATAEAFIPNPFGGAPDDLVYRTGDLGRMRADGVLEFLGRRDSQVKVRGARVELSEVESALREHPRVLDAAVALHDDSDGNAVLHACYVPDGDADPDALRRFVARRLPAHAVPARYVPVDALPRTFNGKLDRKALPRAAPAPAQAVRSSAPRTPTEARLAALWEDVLGIRGIGIQDNFFTWGGHSLLAITLLTRIRKEFGQDIPLATLYQGLTAEATIERLAAVLDRGGLAVRSPCLVRYREHTGGTPLVLVHSATGQVASYAPLVARLAPDRPVYAFQAPGVDGAEPPLTRIEAMAARYVEELRSVQPEGPYLLCGWSMGGMVAYEMARRLAGEGHEIGLLALVDTGGNAAAADPDSTEADLLAHPFLPLLPAGFDVRTLRALPEDSRIGHLLEQVERQGARPFAREEREQLSRLATVLQAHITAQLEYDVPSWDGAVLYFGAEGGFDGARHAGAELFRSVARDCRVIRVPGTHYSVVQEPDVAVLAERLRDALKSAVAAREPAATA